MNEAADASPPYANYQLEVFARRMAGETGTPVDWGELERMAEDALPADAVAWVFGGAGSEDTMRANLAAFRRWRIVPRFLRDVSRRDLRTSVLGTEMPAPVLLAPVGVQSVVHPEGDLASARAAAELGLTFVASTVASSPLEEIAAGGGEGPRWFQLYWPSERDLAASFVKRAEAAGYAAIVVTLDSFLLPWRPRDLRQGFLPFTQGKGLANYLRDPVFRAALQDPPEEDQGAALARFASVFGNAELAWDDLELLRSWTRLPILLKGLQRPDDARRAARRGVDGVIVSNHGGRQVDGALASLDALPAIAEAVRGEVAVLFDSGIRSGADVMKALALGADAVLVGRPFLWGLALDGQAGVDAVLRSLLAELDISLALSGYSRPRELDREALQEAPP